MKHKNNHRTGGEILIDALRINGVERAFCVPGESYLAALDALHDAQEDIELIVCRQEGGATYMAEAYAKLTGKPGIAFVTRGPGATNASVGIHTAFQDSTPMILFIGQVASDQVEREAFQEVDYRRMFGQMAKWVVQIDDVARIPELVSQAFHRAVNGRPGPVVVALPEDMLTDHASISNVPAHKKIEISAGAEQLQELTELVKQAERPVVMLGGSGWDKQAVADMEAFCTANNLPVTTSFRCQDLFNNALSNYAGELGTSANPKLIQSIKDSDLLLVIGARIGEMTSAGYTMVNIPVPDQKLIHVHSGAEELGRVYYPTLPINATMAAFAKQLRVLGKVGSDKWASWTAELNKNYNDNLQHAPIPGNVQMGEIMQWMRANLPEDTIMTTGAGNYTAWPHRFYQYKTFRTQLGATNGSMGYGVPAAIAAKLTDRDRTVIAFAGDGCFMMNGQELATAMQYDARVVFIVVNNGMYGTIRMHQERTYPGRVSGTALANPDFAALAKAYGLHGEVVENTDEFSSAFERSVASGKPALIEIRIDQEAITPKMSLSAMREQALAAQKS
ncbi:thiamine pyrophosphate-binding protein [Bacillus subtilis]|uniref:thiamine pyrophosphate-binding protein n=1 Tax=Pseudochrobactrum asaccharolyticum TaxID=354351 RepID=UPI001F1D4DCB|nr:thiamine pyrophosphate-binding protein [Pseudochrobactrum asaccharolyticum]MCF7646817.1 thiamine pyrophosphate-binding protein [Pseudochrobactrum asaccharolyticum]MCF7672642.1 thiamine pyrophosphate-binding protein [Bacillus subtilis]